MTDTVFVPTIGPRDSRRPEGARVIFLGELVFTIKGVFYDALAKKDVPLPPHRWALRTTTEFIEGATSDDDGVSVIVRRTPTKADADARWDLWLIPIFDDHKTSEEVVNRREVWIDLIRKRWVRPSELASPHIEHRHLLRLPRWTTKYKATRHGGGFRELPPASDFQNTGTFKTSELVTHGTRTKPWTIAVDEGWLRTYVQFRYYDPVARRERPVPHGLVLHAAQKTPRGHYPDVGGASSVWCDGSIYVLHAGTEANVKTDLHYQFETPVHTSFTYAGQTFSSKLTELTDLETDHPIAPRWHSFGQEAWEGAVNAAAAYRKEFESIRTKGTSESAPLCFHLDDVVLANEKETRTGPHMEAIPVGASKRIAIYTTLAGLREPKQIDGKDVPYSIVETPGRLRAEEAMFRHGYDTRETTRFFEWNGDLYDVSTRFIEGAFGHVSRLGARAALRVEPRAKNAPISGIDVEHHRVYFFDTRWVRHDYQGRSPRLAHLVCYVPTHIADADRAANPDAASAVEQSLIDSSRTWDQRHPGIPSNASCTKDYVIVPKEKLDDESTLIKVRHIFGLTDGVGVPIRFITKGDGRAYVDRDHVGVYCERTLFQFGFEKYSPFRAFLEGEFLNRDEIDDTSLPRATFTHEAGHLSGLPDEYIESSNGDHISILLSSFPCFDTDRKAPFRPYALDEYALMRSNRLPRLRYLWPYLEALRKDPPKDATWLRPESFVAEYVTKSRTLRHGTSNRGGPWSATKGRVGLCNVAFFPCPGSDEGTIGPVVLDKGFVDKEREFDGLFLIQPLVFVSYASSMGSSLAGQWRGLSGWAQAYTSRNAATRFAVVTPTATDAKRVAVIFQPRFEFGPSPGDWYDPALQRRTKITAANATFELQVRKHGGAPTFTRGATPMISCHVDDIGSWIMRYALGDQSDPPVVSKRPTTASDLWMLAGALSHLLDNRTDRTAIVTYKEIA